MNGRITRLATALTNKQIEDIKNGIYESLIAACRMHKVSEERANKIAVSM